MEVVLQTEKPNVRKLAESLAPLILQTHLNKYNRNPQLLNLLAGDLSRKINRNIINKGLPPLTPTEQICACTFAQYLPDLNAFAQNQIVLNNF